MQVVFCLDECGYLTLQYFFYKILILIWKTLPNDSNEYDPETVNRSSRVWLLCMDAAGRIKL